MDVYQGDVYVRNSARGVIFGTNDPAKCFRLDVDNDGNIQTNQLECPDYSCNAQTYEEACSNRCGIVSNGCSTESADYQTYDCGSDVCGYKETCQDNYCQPLSCETEMQTGCFDPAQ